MYPFFGNEADRVLWWRRQGDRLRGCLNCLMGLLLVLVVLAAIAAYAVAKTGLVEIPFFSRFYHEPAPIRVVTPAETTIAAILEPQLRNISRTPDGAATLTIELTEAQLTFALREALGGWSADNFSIQNPQLAIADGAMQLYGVANFGTRRAPVRLLLTFSPEEKPLPLRIAKAQIGGLSVWSRLVDFVVRSAVRTQLRAIETHVLNGIEVQNVEFGDGMLRAVLKLSPEALRNF